MRSSLAFAATLLIAGGAAPAQTTESLKFAVIVSRHGVRSPTWTPERLNRYSSAPWPDWGVAPGELTLHGRDLMKTMGGFYRGYFSAKGLLTPGCADRTYIRADSSHRTLETARALAEGLEPGCKLEIHANSADDNDPLFDGSESGSAKVDPALALASVAGRIGPKPASLVEAHQPAFELLNRLLNGNGKASHSVLEDPLSLTAGEAGVTMNGPLALASTLSEDLLLEYSDGMSGDRLGWGRLNAGNLLEVMALHSAYADLMRRTPYLARTRGSNLLNTILRSLEQAETGKPVAGALGSPRASLLVISGHDTNLSNLSGMLGLSWLLPGYQPDDTPPGGALVFTLWQSAATGSYSIRLQYMAQTLDQMHDATALSVASPPAIARRLRPRLQPEHGRLSLYLEVVPHDGSKRHRAWFRNKDHCIALIWHAFARSPTPSSTMKSRPIAAKRTPAISAAHVNNVR